MLSLGLGKQANSTADYALGTMLDLEQNPIEGLKALRSALATERKFACGWNQTAMIYRESITSAMSAGGYVEAERLFGLLVGSGSASSIDWDAEGQRRSDHKDYSEAAIAYGKSEDLFPINACYSALNHYFTPKEEPDDVLSEGRKCIELSSKSDTGSRKDFDRLVPNVHWAMSMTLNQRGVYTEALSHARDAVSMDPQDGSFYFAEAGALRNLGRTQECISAAKQAVTLSDGKYSSYHFLLGNCYFDAENWNAAELSFKTAAQEDKENASAAYNVGLSLQREGYTSDAKSWYQEALRRTSDPELRAKINSALR